MINSPCIRNCCLDERDICLGCFRSLDEILEWSLVDDKEKTLILAATKKRREERNSRYARGN